MENKIRISGIVGDSIVDGLGIRMSVFTQGCPHNCEGCHNPQTHDFSGGYFEEIDSIVGKFVADPLQCGITVSGGEPFSQALEVAELCRRIQELGRNVWIYSGYTFEELCADNAPKGARQLLDYCDVLVDGKFILQELDLNLTFRGSRNQRIIDVKKSRETGKVCELEL